MQKAFPPNGKGVFLLALFKNQIPIYYFKLLYCKELNNYRDYLCARETCG
jgi:hypothetical protein